MLGIVFETTTPNKPTESRQKARINMFKELILDKNI